MKIQLKNIAIICSLMLSISCKKFVEVEAPPTSLTAKNVYTSDATAIAVLTGIYATMSNGTIAEGLSGISIRTGLSSDELTLWSASTDKLLQLLYRNALTSQQTVDFWLTMYGRLYTVNSALEGLSKSVGLNPIVKQQLMGEALFLRAFFYFYLVNIYGDVPLVLTSDYTANAVAPRNSTDQIYKQMIEDLNSALSLLSDKYPSSTITTSTDERIRPTKWAALSLLARVYLYTGDWAQAEAKASEVINHTSLFSLNSLNEVFLKNSSEAIWQLQTVSSDWNTEDGFRFILPGAPSDFFPVYASNFLLSSFEANDQRKANWIGNIDDAGTTYYYPYKYKVWLSSDITEHLMVLRLAEQYLIRSEARAQQGKISEAQDDLNAIRQRAGLDPTAANDNSSLLTAVLHERQVELFTEWGHRWFDLKRAGMADVVMATVTPQKGGAWNPNWKLYPLSFQDIQLNPNLKQNQGY